MSAPRPHIDRLVQQNLPRGIAVARARVLSAFEDPGFYDYCLARYRAGQAKYDYAYEWLHWPGGRFEGEQAEEFADGALYGAMEQSVRDLSEARELRGMG